MRRLVRLAALLHDVGHGPFSHVSEFLMDRFGAPEKPDGNREKIHESASISIIKNAKEIVDLLGPDTVDKVCDLLSPSGQSAEKDIVSGPCDADKMDYLLRDSLFSGVKYGLYDLDWVVHAARIVKGLGTESYLGFHESAILALEQLYHGKHYMTRQVYSHPVRCIADAMIVRGAELSIQSGNQRLRKVFNIEDPDWLDTFLGYHDLKLLQDVLESDDHGSEIYSRLLKRRLWRIVFNKPTDNLWQEATRFFVGQKVRNLFDSGDVSSYESAVAAAIGVQPWEVIIDIRGPSSPGRLGPDVSTPDEGMYFISDANTVREAGRVFPKSLAMNTTNVFVYAPCDMEGADRARQLKRCDQAIAEVLTQEIGG